jgi:Protein of unknown function (DUF3303)
MLVMLQYRFRGGSAGRDAYQRFSKWTPSEGLEIKGAWTSASNAGGFMLLEVANFGVLMEFSAQFKDLNEDIEITPVVELAEGIAVVAKAYAWVDSVS